MQVWCLQDTAFYFLFLLLILWTKKWGKKVLLCNFRVWKVSLILWPCQGFGSNASFSTSSCSDDMSTFIERRQNIVKMSASSELPLDMDNYPWAKHCYIFFFIFCRDKIERKKRPLITFEAKKAHFVDIFVWYMLASHLPTWLQCVMYIMITECKFVRRQITDYIIDNIVVRFTKMNTPMKYT